jgi:hypothetical protein
MHFDSLTSPRLRGIMVNSRFNALARISGTSDRAHGRNMEAERSEMSMGRFRRRISS